MKGLNYFLAGMILTALPSVALAAPSFYCPKVCVSKPYDLAISTLIKSGFRPVVLKHNEDLHSDDGELFCGDDFCKRYPEVLNCTGTGLNPCRFAYESADKKVFDRRYPW